MTPVIKSCTILEESNGFSNNLSPQRARIFSREAEKKYFSNQKAIAAQASRRIDLIEQLFPL